MTAWRSPMRATERATRAGSSGSQKVGLPVLTLQNPQRRVHVSPRIMKVAVPRSQHSPMLGQAASWQTVWSPSRWIRARSSRYPRPPGGGRAGERGPTPRRQEPPRADEPLAQPEGLGEAVGDAPAEAVHGSHRAGL